MDPAASGSPYLFWLIGIVVLGAVLAFVVLRGRKISSRERAVADQGAERVYEAEQRDPANR